MQFMQILPQAEFWNKKNVKEKHRSFIARRNRLPNFFYDFVAIFIASGWNKKLFLENSKVHRVNKTESLCVSFLLFFSEIPL